MAPDATFRTAPCQPHRSRTVPGPPPATPTKGRMRATASRSTYSLPGHVGMRDSKLGPASPVLDSPYRAVGPRLTAVQDSTLDA